MKGRVRYTFEIATRREGRVWQVLVARSGLFSRTPKSTARSIVERWIFEQQGQLRGGRVVIQGRRTAAPKGFETTVRVRVLAGDGSGRQLAVAYIGVDRSQTTPRDTYTVPDLRFVSAGQLTGHGRH